MGLVTRNSGVTSLKPDFQREGWLPGLVVSQAGGIWGMECDYLMGLGFPFEVRKML